MKIYKVIYISAAVAASLALASCAKENGSEVAQTNAVGFNTYSPKSLTKAGGSLVTGTDFSEVDAANQVIGVYAWQHTMDFADATSEPDFMGIGEAGATKVTLAGNGATASANYTPTKYWPTDESNLLTFAAYYPYGDAGITAPTWGDGSKGLEYGFGVNGTDPKGHVDFMLADIVPDDTYSKSKDQSGTPGAVKFTFRHQLTKVLFKVKLAEEVKDCTVSLDKLSFVACTAGTFTQTYDASSEKSTFVAGEGTATFTPCNDLLVLTGDAVSVPYSTVTDEESKGGITPENKSSYLMIPQKFPTVLVKYSVTQSDGKYTDTFYKQINLSDVTYNSEKLTGWESNKSITYTLEIGLKVIKLDADVADWSTVEKKEIPL